MSEKPTYREQHGKTRVGNFLSKVSNVGPDILEMAGQITGVRALEELGKRISKDPSIDPADKEALAILIQQDIEEARELTKRWESDNQQEHWLPRNVRPLTLAVAIIFTLTMIALDSSLDDFAVSERAYNYLEILSMSALGGYFALRTYEKHDKIKRYAK